MITQRKRVRSRSAGCFCHRYHSVVDPVAAIENAEIVIVGGGKTFQLLKQCRERGLPVPLLTWLNVRTPYGWSAGANLACLPFAPPTICRLSICKVSMR
ncbi:Type 1 glutamine amidotransferase-like domain-containing protein [Shigella flexneri]